MKKKQNDLDHIAYLDYQKKCAAAAAQEQEKKNNPEQSGDSATDGDKKDDEEDEEGLRIGTPVVDEKGKKRVSWARNLVDVLEFEKDGFNKCVPKKSREAFLKEIEEEKRLMGTQQTLWIDEKDAMVANIEWSVPAALPASVVECEQKPNKIDITEANRLSSLNQTKMFVRYRDLSDVPKSPEEPPSEDAELILDASVKKIPWVPPPALVQRDQNGNTVKVNVEVLQQNFGALLKYVNEKKKLQQATASTEDTTPQQQPRRPLPAFLLRAVEQQQQQQHQPPQMQPTMPPMMQPVQQLPPPQQIPILPTVPQQNPPQPMYYAPPPQAQTTTYYSAQPAGPPASLQQQPQMIWQPGVQVIPALPLPQQQQPQPPQPTHYYAGVSEYPPGPPPPPQRWG